MVEVVFEYKDKLSNGKWNKQSCIVSSVERAKEIYGLGVDPDCEYKILNVKDLSEEDDK